MVSLTPLGRIYHRSLWLVCCLSFALLLLAGCAGTPQHLISPGPAIYAAWLALGFWDLAHNEKLPHPARLGWMAALVAVPILGPVAYYLFGHSQLSRLFRLMFVLGAPVLYLAVTGLLVWVASL